MFLQIKLMYDLQKHGYRIDNLSEPFCTRFFLTKHTDCWELPGWSVVTHLMQEQHAMPTEHQHLPWHTGFGTDRAGLMPLKKQLSSSVKSNSARLLPDRPLSLILIYFSGKGPSSMEGMPSSLFLFQPMPLPVGKLVLQAQLLLALKPTTVSLQPTEETPSLTGKRCKIPTTPTQASRPCLLQAFPKL